MINNAKASVASAKSAYEFAAQMAARYTNLYQQKAGSLQDMQKYQTQATQIPNKLWIRQMYL